MGHDSLNIQEELKSEGQPLDLAGLLDELKEMSISQLVTIARNLGIDCSQGIRKQELLFRILQKKVEQSETPEAKRGDGSSKSRGNESASRIITLELVTPQLIVELESNPELLRDMSWRAFEHLLAEILERLGYEVELQRGTKDGGVDIYALKKHDTFGRHRYLVQAKKWSRPVGVDPVRNVMFLHSDLRMSKSCLATTSTFTRGAWQLGDLYKWQLELKDQCRLREWIEEAARSEVNRTLPEGGEHVTSEFEITGK